MMNQKQQKKKKKKQSTRFAMESSWCTLLLLSSSFIVAMSCPLSSVSVFQEKESLKEDVRRMFYHAYDNYMLYAFPHDELKPLSHTFTDSLGELGNLKLEHLTHTYNGTALTLIESLSSLVIMGNHTEFLKAVSWLGQNLSFDVDVRVNVFECNIRLLGGLISAHLLAKESSSSITSGEYKDQLLLLAEDLGQRLLPAFKTPTGIPYAWINLKHGVRENETTETSTAGCGSLILEMGALSRVTGNPQFEIASLNALRRLWSMRSSLNLLGTTLDVATGEWIERSSGIGAGIDSFYEYLLKAHILFGSEEYWQMFHHAYLAVQQHFRYGPWYHEADMRTGKATYWQFTSLQAFWPAVQVLIGDIHAANITHREFFRVWEKYGVFPERYLIDTGTVHPTEKYYPLRPELAESTFYLYQATKDPWYLKVGKHIINSLNVFTRVKGGYASVKDVVSMELEDHQHSFFLSETCKYLYLLFDDTFLSGRNYVFSTEGHPLPVLKAWQSSANWKMEPSKRAGRTKKGVSERSALTSKICPDFQKSCVSKFQKIESVCHVPDRQQDFRCKSNKECGFDATTCKKRMCSVAGYCGLW